MGGKKGGKWGTRVGRKGRRKRKEEKKEGKRKKTFYLVSYFCTLSLLCISSLLFIYPHLLNSSQFFSYLSSKTYSFILIESF